MPFGAIVGTLGVGGTIAAGTGIVGLGLSAASASGAFNGPVDSNGPTPEELQATKQSKKVFEFSQKIRKPIDALARKDLDTLRSPGQADLQEGNAVNQVMGADSPALERTLATTAAGSGGPGSGRFAARLGAAGSQLDSDVTKAKVGGRLSALQEYLARSGQYVDRKSQDLETGMGLVQSGGDAAASRQAARIGAQVQRNIGTNQAVGQIGGSLMSLGMSGLSAAGGAGGVSPGSETGVGGRVVDLKNIPSAGYRGALSGVAGSGQTYGSMGNIAMAFG